MNIRIELDEVKKIRNKHEYRMVGRASFDGHEVVGDGFIIKNLCAKLLDNRYDPQSIVEVFRGKTLCFHPKTLHEWGEDYRLEIKRLQELKNR